MTLRTNNVFISISITVLTLAVTMAFVTKAQGPFFSPKPYELWVQERYGRPPVGWDEDDRYAAEVKVRTKLEFTSLVLLAGCAFGFATYGVLARPKSSK